MSKELEIHELKNKLSTLAERVAHEAFGKQLDYSVESVKEVESILAVLHNEYKSTGSEDGLEGIAMEFGAYIVKVIDNTSIRLSGSATMSRLERTHFHCSGEDPPCFLSAGVSSAFLMVLATMFGSSLRPLCLITNE